MATNPERALSLLRDSYNRPTLAVAPNEYILQRLFGWDGAARRLAAYFHALDRVNAAHRVALTEVRVISPTRIAA